MTTALITGVTGQDGSLLAEQLLAKGYRVIGGVREMPPSDHPRLQRIWHDLEFQTIDLLEETGIRALIDRTAPDEIYNFAARASSSQLSDQPVLTGEINGLAVLRILESIRIVNPCIRLCQASSSEIFGASFESPQRETTPPRPRNPYGMAKLSAHWFVGHYRLTFGMFACSAILYNHESPRRSPEFVTRKISAGVAEIKHGRKQRIRLGDLDAKRDWGFAGDYMQAMWKMLQVPAADDYVLATGIVHSVREFCEIAFDHVGLDYKDHVESDPTVVRGRESIQLVGDPTKAHALLDWQPRVTFSELVTMMVDEDMRRCSSTKIEN